MHLDRTELQLLLMAARSAAYAARADEERRRVGGFTSPEAYERLAVRLENELVRAGPPSAAPAPPAT
jgi:hypothetical protein